MGKNQNTGLIRYQYYITGGKFMKGIRFFVLCSLSFALVLASVYPLCARAPKTEKITFSSNRDGNLEIYVMNPDGSDQVNLTRHKAADYSPVWSPTGEHILFVSTRDGLRDLFLMDANGRNVRRVFRKMAQRVEPTWAPDGQRIAYHAETPQWSIQTGTIQGIGDVQVALAEVQGGNPSWSPDGEEIAFVAGVDSRRIYIAELRSRTKRAFLPNEASWMYYPTWSPDGTKLAFTWLKWGLGNRRAIYVANRDGSGLKQIGKPVLGIFHPAWSPDGEKLVYTEEVVDRDRQIVTIDLLTRRKKQLTRRGLNFTPSWFNPAFATLPVAPQPQLLTTVWGKMKAD
jgi:Tol biopolymer transport system component